MPDCESDGCQWGDEVWCDACPLRTDKRMALVRESSHPLYRLSSQYMHEHRLGIPRAHPGIRVAMAMQIVDGERNRIESAEAKKRAEQAKRDNHGRR